MTATFLSAWVKLRRPALLGGTYLVVAALTALVTAVLFLTAGDPAGPGQRPGGQAVGIADLEAAGGLLQGLRTATSFVGVVALSVAAAAFAGEYANGTLRNLLIRRPQRLRLLAGTWAATAAFAVGAVLVATVVAGGSALALAPAQGVDTTAWFGSDGWADAGRTLSQVALAAAGYATLGAALGILMRASVPAVAAGLAWLMVVELVLSSTLDGADRWLPGRLLSAIASNGTAQVTLTTALITTALYLTVAAVAAGTSFVRRDVTA